MHYCGDFRTTYEKDIEILQTPTTRIGVAAFLAFLVVFPFLVKGEYLWVGLQILIAVIGAVGLNILTGYTGQISLGQGAFFGVGAYTTAYITAKMGLSFWVGVPAAGLVTAAAGMVFGIPSLRLKGLYLAIATLASQFILEWVFLRWEPVTGGSLRDRRPASLDRGVRLRFRPLLLLPGPRDHGRDGPVRDEPDADPDGPRLHGDPGPLHLGGDHGDQPLQVPDPLLRGLLVLRRGRRARSRAFAEIRHLGAVQHRRLDRAYLAMIIIGGLGSILGSIYGAIFMILLPKLLTVVTTEARRCYPGDRGPRDRDGAGDVRR